MRIKFCGMTRLEDVRAAAALGVDFIGLIRAASPRAVSPEAARRIVADLRAARDSQPSFGDEPARSNAVAGPPPARVPEPVLLLRDAPLDDALHELAATGADWLQLHGRETVAYAAALCARFPHLQLIRAWEIADTSADAALLAFIREAATAGLPLRAVILDAPKRGPFAGPAALCDLSRRWPAAGPELWLAGGLTPATVAGALRAGRFSGVDVARGIESAPGLKDPAAMSAFVAAVRACD
jgi:phosphoribosylanthranilate isomerase